MWACWCSSDAGGGRRTPAHRMRFSSFDLVAVSTTASSDNRHPPPDHFRGRGLQFISVYQPHGTDFALMEQISKRLMNWASILEDSTREQAVLTSTMPFIHPHLALMPDAHLGKGATVGSVIPTLRAIIPAAVGVDIGCGMIAVRTQYQVAELPMERRGFLREAIEAAVPLSAGKYNPDLHRDHTLARVRDLEDRAAKASFDPAGYAANWRLQLGSLGSGNHFIEVSLDQEDRVWLFLHSGSRGVGNKIAQHHIKIAQKLCAQWWIDLPDPDLAYLVEDTDEFWAYIRELRW